MNLFTAERVFLIFLPGAALLLPLFYEVDFAFSYIYFVSLFCAVLYKSCNCHTQPENSAADRQIWGGYNNCYFAILYYVLLWQVYVFYFVCFIPSKSPTFSDFIPKSLTWWLFQNSNSVPDTFVVGYGTAPSVH